MEIVSHFYKQNQIRNVQKKQSYDLHFITQNEESMEK
jgi:hypothetical protein